MVSRLTSSSVTICTLIRVDSLSHLGSDITYSGTNSVLWSCIEANVGIICACLPLMRPLITWIFPWFAQKTSRDAGTYTAASGNIYTKQGDNTYAKNTYAKQSSQADWNAWPDKDQAMILSNITARDQEESRSRSSSEVAITHGIQRKVEVETYFESAEDNRSDQESDKYSRRPSESHAAPAV